MWSWLKHSKRATALRPRKRQPRCLFDRLEDRLALAGNVAAVVTGGNLIVTGDNAGAEVTISQPSAGKFTLTSENTKINGAIGSKTFSGVTRDVRFNFGSGDDLLFFDQSQRIRIGGSFIVGGGAGNNTILSNFAGAEPVVVGKNVTITNQVGLDGATELRNWSVSGNVQIVNQAGNSYVGLLGDLNSETPTPMRIGGNVSITNGIGNLQSVQLASVNIGGSTTIKNQGESAFVSAMGINVGRDLLIDNGVGVTNGAEIQQAKIGRNLQVTGNASEATDLSLAEVEVKGATNLQSGDGNDSIVVGSSTFAGRFQLQSGKGADILSIASLAESTVLVLVPVFETGLIEVDGEVVPFTIVKFVPVMKTSAQVPGKVAFGNSVIAGLGYDNDTLNLARDARVTFKKLATFDGQRGTNDANYRLRNLSPIPVLLNFRLFA